MQRFHVFKFVRPGAMGGFMDRASAVVPGETAESIDVSTLEKASAWLESLCASPETEWGYVVDAHLMKVVYELNTVATDVAAPAVDVGSQLNRYLVFKFVNTAAAGGWADLAGTVVRESDAVGMLKSLCVDANDWGHVIDTFGNGGAEPTCVFVIGAGPQRG